MDLISLHSSSLTGQVPTCLGDYANVTSLDVANNQLTGSLPESLCDASMLQYVEFNNNHLTGTVLKETL